VEGEREQGVWVECLLVMSDWVVNNREYQIEVLFLVCHRWETFLLLLPRIRRWRVGMRELDLAELRKARDREGDLDHHPKRSRSDVA